MYMVTLVPTHVQINETRTYSSAMGGGIWHFCPPA